MKQKKMAQILILLQSFSVMYINNDQKERRIEVGKQEKSKVALAAEKALDEAKKMAQILILLQSFSVMYINNDQKKDLKWESKRSPK